MIAFRDVTPADPAARALLSEYFADRVAGFPGGPDAYSVSYPDEDRFAHGALIVAVDAGPEPSGATDAPGVPLGVGGVRPLGAGVFEVKHLFVRPAARGTGTGRALLAELESRAHAAGARRLVLDSNDSLVAAAALYRSAGFTTVPAYNDNPNATTWYAKELG